MLGVPKSSSEIRGRRSSTSSSHRARGGSDSVAKRDRPACEAATATAAAPASARPGVGEALRQTISATPPSGRCARRTPRRERLHRHRPPLALSAPEHTTLERPGDGAKSCPRSTRHALAVSCSGAPHPPSAHVLGIEARSFAPVPQELSLEGCALALSTPLRSGVWEPMRWRSKLQRGLSQPTLEGPIQAWPRCTEARTHCCAQLAPGRAQRVTHRQDRRPPTAEVVARIGLATYAPGSSAKAAMLRVISASLSSGH